MRSRITFRPSPFRLWLLATVAGTSIASPALAGWLATGNPACTEPHAQNNLSIVSDEASGAVLTWQDDRFGNIDIFAQRVDSTGAKLWTADGVFVCTQSAFQNMPSAAVGFNNGATIFWQDARLTGEFDIYAQRLSATGAPLWALDGVPLSTASHNQGRPVAISDGAAGGINPHGYIATWLEGSAGDQAIVVQHVNESGTGLWTSAAIGGIRLAIALSNASHPRLVTDNTGTLQGSKGAVVVWPDERTVGNAHDIFARRVDNAGTPQWMANGVPVCDHVGEQQNPDLVHIGNGSVIVVWDDSRTPDRDIYAQMLDVTGSSQWADNGLPVCQSSGAQSAPRIVNDGALGAIVVWTDDRSVDSKVYAQRIDVNGQRLWDPNGIPVCSASGTQTFPAITSDGAGGAIVAWTDRRNGDADIYAQRIDANGNLLWGPTGSPMGVVASSNQLSCLVASDGKLGALVAWGDLRTGTSDIYINRAFASYGNVDVPLDAAVATRLVFVSSHPASGAILMRLDLSAPAEVEMAVLDAAGRRVQSGGRTEMLDSGSHLLTWDGRDDAGSAVRPGVYFARVRAGATTLVKRIVEVR